MHNPLIVENAVRSFGDRKALNGASFELRKGEFLALLGPNGAGKTTLIRSIAGRLRLDGGEIRLHGQIVVPGAKTPETARLGDHPAEHCDL